MQKYKVKKECSSLRITVSKDGTVQTDVSNPIPLLKGTILHLTPIIYNFNSYSGKVLKHHKGSFLTAMTNNDVNDYLELVDPESTKPLTNYVSKYRF